MSRDYSPRGDSVAGQLLTFLQNSAPGTRITPAEIAGQFDAVQDNLCVLLKKSLQQGLLAFTTEGQTRYYHLPEQVEAEEEAAPGPLAIATDSTGDLWFSGARVTSDGEVLLSPEQLHQLVQFATTAPAARQGATS